jgi:hypothetical protein
MQLFLKRSTFYFLLCGTLIMMGIMAKTGSPLTTAATPSGILNLEFANTKAKVDSTLTAWTKASSKEKDINAAAKINTGFDFVFLLFYSFFLYSCCRQLAVMLPAQNSLAKWLSYFSAAALAAGFLDVFENFGMLRSLSGHSSNSIAFATSVISLIKWLLVILVLLSLIAGMIVKILMNKKRKVIN